MRGFITRLLIEHAIFSFMIRRDKADVNTIMLKICLFILHELPSQYFKSLVQSRQSSQFIASFFCFKKII